MQSTSTDSTLRNNWEEVDGKEVTSLTKETNGKKENVILVKEVSFLQYSNLVPI